MQQNSNKKIPFLAILGVLIFIAFIIYIDSKTEQEHKLFCESFIIGKITTIYGYDSGIITIIIDKSQKICFSLYDTEEHKILGEKTKKGFYLKKEMNSDIIITSSDTSFTHDLRMWKTSCNK